MAQSNTLDFGGQHEVSFAKFMDMALFGANGYYMRSVAIGGRGADFYTAAQSPLFAGALANALAKQWEVWGGPSELQVVEYGGGQGELAAVLGPALAQLLDTTEITYTLVDRSLHLQAQQESAVQGNCSRDRQNLRYRFASPVKGLPTFVVANEVLDALPVERLRRTKDGWQQAYVAWGQERGYQLVWKPAARDLALVADEFLPIPDGTEGEISTGLDHFFSEMGNTGSRVFAWLIDYGIDKGEWASGIRPLGTVRGYYRHQVTDALERVGEQDITADVNWEYVKRVAQHAGFCVEFLESQGTFLVANGITDAYQARLLDLEVRGNGTVKDRLALSGQLKQLIMPGGMGERFQVFGCERIEGRRSEAK